jgi:hypothetical protein
MIGYKIDAFNETITEVEYNGDYTQIYPHLNGARAFDVARLYANHDVAYVDDEGLYRENQSFWVHRNYTQPLAGDALILGTDEEGESISPKTTIEQLRNDIVFIGDRFMLQMFYKLNGDVQDITPFFFKETA